MTSDDKAIEVVGAFKRYGKNTVILGGLNMTVPKGKIYGLLGASGCGKTTLLSCVIGQRDLDSGQIKLFIDQKSQLGYMPQEISLSEEMTIGEVFLFYGRLYKMPLTSIVKRSTEIMELLQLPPTKRPIGSCSGGQQRRVSLGVTLLHEPPLLVLDEPTVGVDPLLCESIWEHFLDIVYVKQTTIIITTHYLEEAKRSDIIFIRSYLSKVGLMRGGVLLTEESPTALMETHNVSTLEEVFLQLSIQQNSEAVDPLLPSKETYKSHFKRKEYTISWSNFKAQTVKSLVWTARNLGITFFIIFLPSFLNIVIGFLDQSATSRIISVLTNENCDNQTFQLSPLCDAEAPYFSCAYIDQLQSKYHTITYEDSPNTLDMIRKGNPIAVFQFPLNYTYHIIQRVINGIYSSTTTLQSSKLLGLLDDADYLTSKIVERDAVKYFSNVIKREFTKCGYHSKLLHYQLSLPGDTHKEFYGDTTMFQSYWSAYYVSITFYSSMMFSSMAFLMERNSGSFERSQAAGLTLAEVLLALFVIHLSIVLLQSFFGFLVLFQAFNMPLQGSLLTILLIVLCISFFGMAYGIFLAFLIKIERNVTYFSIGSVLTVLLLCGTIWPREGLHWALKPLSWAIPVTHGAEAFANVAIKGFVIHDPCVYWGLLASLFGFLLCAFGSFLLNLRE